MNYTIKEVLAGQIRVEFEDGSWAIVPIKENATLEEIDNAVSEYDPDFLPDPETLKNTNISIGETRTSIKSTSDTATTTNFPIGIGTHTHFIEQSLAEDFTADIIKDTIDFGLQSGNDVLALANYYAEKGDTRIKDALTLKIEKYISDPNFSLDEFVQRLEFDADDIVAQAEAELNG